jgi:hypothetical protein
VAHRKARKLQPLSNAIRQLFQAGLTGADLLWTFVSRRIQPLQRWAATIWMYLGPSCSDHSFSAELNNVEIETLVQRILTLEAHRNSSPSPIPLREGVASPWVSPLKLASS